MAKYYQAPQVNAPISTFTPYNIEFVQGQLDKSQDRYDRANTAKSQAFSAMNEIDTATPEDLARKNQLMDGLHQKYDDIDTRYNGNLAAASSEITNFIGNIRKDDFWKRNEYSIKQQALEQEQRIKLGANYLGFQDSQGAWDDKNKRLRSNEEMQAQSMGKEDWQKIGLNSLSMLTPNSLNAKGQELGLGQEYADELKKVPGLPFYQFLANKGITAERLKGIINNEKFIDSFLKNAPSFKQAHERGTTDGAYKAGDSTKAAYNYLDGIMQPFVNRQTNTNYNQEQRGTSVNVATGTPPVLPNYPTIGVTEVSTNENVALKTNADVKLFTDAFTKASQEKIGKYVISLQGKITKADQDLIDISNTKYSYDALFEKGIQAIAQTIPTVTKSLNSSQLKIVQSISSDLTDYQKSLDEYIYGDSKITPKEIEAKAKSIHTKSAAGGASLQTASTLITHLDPKYIKEARENFRRLTTEYNVVYKAQLAANGNDKKKAAAESIKILDGHGKGLNAVVTESRTALLNSNAPYIGSAANAVTMILGKATDNTIPGFTFTNSSNLKVDDKVTSDKFNSKNIDPRNLKINFLNGTIGLTDNGDANRPAGVFNLPLKAIKETSKELYKLVKIPHEIFNVALDPSDKGFTKGNKTSPLNVKITTPSGVNGYVQSFSSEYNGVDDNGIIKKKITLNLGSSVSGGKTTPYEITGTPQDIAAQLSQTFGQDFLNLALRAFNTVK